MNNKLIAIWKIIWAYDFVVISDGGIHGRTHNGTGNGKFIKAIIEATLKAKENDT